MSKRMTRCLTWGQMETEGVPLVGDGGRIVGHVCFGQYVTLCGRGEDDPEVATVYEYAKKRPVGVCPRCWSQYREDMSRAVEVEHGR